MLEGESIDKYGIYEIELNTDIFCGFFDLLRSINQYKGTLANLFGMYLEMRTSKTF